MTKQTLNGERKYWLQRRSEAVVIDLVNELSPAAEPGHSATERKDDWC
jgi:hypothetical protein